MCAKFHELASEGSIVATVVHCIADEQEGLLVVSSNHFKVGLVC